MTDIQILKIYIGEGDYHHDLPVYEYLIYQARDVKMAGATLVKSPMGFGKDELSEDIRYKISNDSGVLIEIADTAEKISDFIPIAQEAMDGRGLLVRIDAERIV